MFEADYRLEAVSLLLKMYKLFLVYASRFGYRLIVLGLYGLKQVLKRLDMLEV